MMRNDMIPLRRQIQEIAEALARLRVPALPGEYDIHSEIDRILTDAGIEHAHECPLAPRCRIDFVAGRVGIEVKKGRPQPSALRRQAARYLQSDRLDAMIIVSQQAVPMPDTLAGKPVCVLSLNRLWGVALP